jgi:alkylation response protein AidB-like acyl-CoA dehydrogenase
MGVEMGFSSDQEQFKDIVGRFMADKSPPTAVRENMASEQGYDPAVWLQLSQEVGVLGTHLPEAYGGFGFGPVEQGIISEEMGRYLYCGPYFASAVMAGYAILNGGDETQKSKLLAAIASGDVIAAFAIDDLNDPTKMGQSFSRLSSREGETLTGSAPMVVDAHIADVLIIPVNDNGVVGLFEVAADDAKILARECLDPTRKLSSVTLLDSPATQVGELQKDAVMRLWDEMNTALAHEMIGGSERLFRTTLEYMNMRVQFGRQIGSFQALKHRCADLLLALELAKAATHEAGRFLATGEGDCYAPNMAKALAGDTYLDVAKAAIQLRGGIGFTWEEDTHMWFKRAKSSEVFLGTPNWHREQMMQRMEAQGHV